MSSIDRWSTNPLNKLDSGRIFIAIAGVVTAIGLFWLLGPWLVIPVIFFGVYKIYKSKSSNQGDS